MAKQDEQDSVNQEKDDVQPKTLPRDLVLNLFEVGFSWPPPAVFDVVPVEVARVAEEEPDECRDERTDEQERRRPLT
jgi:hypothetical protein